MKGIRVKEITTQQKEIFEKHFADENGHFYFEGMWLRNQREKNAAQSGWTDETTQRRRYVHFYDRYVVENENDKNYLTVKDTYVVVSNTLPIEEIKRYKQKIESTLNKQNYIKENDNLFSKNNFEVLVFEYDNHPKNQECNAVFPNNYKSYDVVFKTKNYEWQNHYNRMWEHSTKMFRIPEKREKPTYETDVKKLAEFLPAQIEMGCGPSIETGIPPLYEMHETYRVQNHIDKTFYFADKDDLIFSIITNPQTMYEKFAKVPVLCLQAQHTEAYKQFNKAYQNKLFVGTVYNNNFDRLVARFDIPEIILRIYEKSTYLPKIKFEDNVKSLICMGCHADRRQVQKQAREQGLKVIFVDPEGFITDDGFTPYPIEGPKDEDIIYKMTFTEFMQKFSDEFL